MIYIKQNQINRFALELDGSSAFSPPGYLFQFDPEWTLNGTAIYFTTPDISPFPERYSLFQMTESATGGTGPSIQDGPISLFPGQYRYTVYAGTGPIDPDSPEDYLLVQVGRMFVDGFAALTGGTGATSALYS